MKILTSLLLITLLVSCQSKSGKKFDKLEKMNWLIGNWEQKLPDGTLIEKWKKDTDRVRYSFSFRHHR